jgi:hypothetical protein
MHLKPGAITLTKPARGGRVANSGLLQALSPPRSPQGLPTPHYFMPAPWIYRTGETARIGDVVSLGHWPGVLVELVTEAHPDWSPTTGDGSAKISLITTLYLSTCAIKKIGINMM